MDDSLLVTLAGNDSPFDVTRDRLLAPLQVAAQGPPVSFEAPVAVAELTVPGRVTVPPLAGWSREPALAAVETGDMIYAGRIADTTVDATVFSVQTGTSPQVAIYVFEGDLAIVVATVPPDRAPGYSRNTVGPPEGNADIVFFGPLDRDVAVVVLEADGQPIAAVRPRARLALFNTLEVPREATLHLVGHGSTGTVIHEGTISPVPGG